MRLWTHLIGAVRGSAQAAAATEATELISGSPAGWPRIVDALAAGLAEQTQPLVIVLDDIQAVTNPEALASLGQFLAQLPATCHLVLAGRHDPDIPLARWRVTGELLEIRTGDLRCSLAESQALVHEGLGLQLADKDVATIHERTMGWLAGIRLAATALSRRPRSAAGASALTGVGTIEGAYDALGDYLIEEVLDTLEDDTRRFVLDISVLTRLEVGLCDHVAQTTASAALLSDFERSGSFITRTADGTYRQHDLVRDALRTILHRQAPARETELRLRAAHWLHDHGQPIDAVSSALEAERPELAERWLIESTRALVEAKQIETLCAFFDRLDATGHEFSPSGLFMWSASNLYGNRPAIEIDRVLDRARRAFASLSDEDRDQGESDLVYLAGSYASLDEIRLFLEAIVGHREGNPERAGRAAEALGQPSLSGLTEALAGVSLIFREQYSAGMDLGRRWQAYVERSIGVAASNLGHSRSWLAYGLLGQGKLTEAERVAGRASETLRAMGLTEVPAYALVTLPAGWVAWERGDLTAAETIVDAVAPAIGAYGEVPTTVLARMLQARVRFSKGDPEAAFAALEEARVMSTGRPVRGHFAERLIFEQLRLHLLLGDPAAARLDLPDWRERIERGPAGMREQLLLARLLIESGEDATTLLDELPEGAEVTVVHDMELAKLRALVALRDGDEAAALEALTGAMRIAVHSGHRQMFLDSERALGAVLDNAAARSGFLLRFDRDAPPVAPLEGAQAVLIEPLSDRELELLRLLPSHLSYREIGAHMFLSTNTVKSYVQSIYRKLDAERRSEAVEHARSLGLVP